MVAGAPGVPKSDAMCLQCTGGGTRRPKLGRGTIVRVAGAPAAWVKGVPKSECAAAVGLLSPKTTSACSFSMFESSARVVWKEPPGTGGTKVRHVSGAPATEGVPKSESPTTLPPQPKSEEYPTET
jgi:hypothetical protein